MLAFFGFDKKNARIPKICQVHKRAGSGLPHLNDSHAKPQRSGTEKNRASPPVFPKFVNFGDSFSHAKPQSRKGPEQKKPGKTPCFSKICEFFAVHFLTQSRKAAKVRNRKKPSKPPCFSKICEFFAVHFLTQSRKAAKVRNRKKPSKPPCFSKICEFWRFIPLFFAPWRLCVRVFP